MTEQTNYRLRLIPVVGWIFILWGLLFPLENRLLLFIWWVDIFLSVGVHSLQLFIAVPIGKRRDIPIQTTVLNTMLYGALWWKPLQGKQAGR